MKVVRIIFGALWEMPQNISGFILWVLYQNKIRSVKISQERIFLEVRNFGISLGSFIFWTESGGRDNRKHEYGHSIQSRFLGPLYLLVIGIPSVIRATYSRYYFKKTKTSWTNYFQGYPEDWADQLGKRYFKGVS